MKRVLITGITGQDGSYLADLLTKAGHEVHGLVRRSSTGNLGRIQHLLDKVTLHKGDVADAASVYRVLTDVRPHWLFNEADQDNVDWSYSCPQQAVDVTYGGCATILEAVRQWERDGEEYRQVKVFQPCSATMFVGSREAIGEEGVILVNPQSPYAVAKLACYHLCRHYREAHGMHVSTAILFNHDSPRRGEGYLLGKLVREARLVKEGKLEAITVGSLSQRVDIGYAKEYMEAVVKIMELDAPDDFVLGTGKGVMIEALAVSALQHVKAEETWNRVKENPSYRPGPSPTLIADASKAKRVLGWQPKLDALGVLDLLLEEGK